MYPWTNTVSPLESPPGGGFFNISRAFEGGRGGGLFNLEKTMVLVLHKELEHKVEKLKYKKLEVMQLTSVW